MLAVEFDPLSNLSLNFTVDHSCRGPLSYMRGSRGLRCPRNQPLALWQLLQLSLARRQFHSKISSLTKTPLIDWSHSAPADPPGPGLTHRQYSQQLQRNRQLLRAILALDVDGNQSNGLESYAVSGTASTNDMPPHTRRSGQLASFGTEAKLSENYSSLLEMDDASSTSSKRNNPNADQSPYQQPYQDARNESMGGFRSPLLNSEILLQSQLPIAHGEIGKVNSTLRNQEEDRGHNHFRHFSQHARNEHRTWSAHVVHTTELPNESVNEQLSHPGSMPLADQP